MSMTGIDAFGVLLIALEMDVKRFENQKSSYCLSANDPVRHRRTADRRA